MKSIIRIIKDIVKFIVNLFNSINTLRIIVCNTDMRNHIPKIEKADSVTLLANGPSLDADLEKLDFSDGVFCVVNDFYKSPWFYKIKPKYQVLADPLYFTKDSDLQPFADAVKWDMKMMVPYAAWKRLKILRDMPNPQIEVLPYHKLSYKAFKIITTFLYKKGLSMPIAQNVVVAALFNLINMGYKEIRLYGVDHSWTESIRVNDHNQVCLTDSHFYDAEKVKLLPWKKCSGEQYLMHEVLRDLAQMFDSYHAIREYADKCGCRILNLTKGSYIDAFERA